MLNSKHFFSIVHDESCFRSGETTAKRWFYSDGVQYVERSASESIQVGNGGYFNNNTIIGQFTRSFKMLLFKKAYSNHDFHIVVDNARTHSAKHYSVEEFGMKPGTHCPVDQIFYRDKNGKRQTIDCFFKAGDHKGQSKG